MKWYHWTILILVTALCISILIDISANCPNQQILNILYAILSSIIATMICVALLLHDINKPTKNDEEYIVNRIYEILSKENKLHFNKVDLNMNMGEAFWINLIEDLDSTSEPVWFLSTSLRYWYREATYNIKLKKKIEQRLRNIVTNYHISKNDEDYMKTYFMIVDKEYFDLWLIFFEKIIEKILSEHTGRRKASLHELLWSKFVLVNVDQYLVKYSIVVCGRNATVVLYTSDGKVIDNSPTFDINSKSVLRNLFISDLEKIHATSLRK